MGFERLLAWAGELAAWQQDALRRIAVSPTLSPQDKEEIHQNLRATHGLEDPDPRNVMPLAAHHVPSSEAAGPRTVLLSIGELRNTNRLAEDQTLRFAIRGMTVIYGDNGSGKSGYCRLAKKLCRARTIDNILGNVFQTSAQGPAEATIRFQSETSAIEEIRWRDGEDAPTATSRISVFDSHSAALYVDAKNKIEYLPAQIEIVRQLGQVCLELAGRIDAELEEVRPAVNVPLPLYPENTEVASLISKLTAEAHPDDVPADGAIRSLATCDESSDAQLLALERELAEDQGRRTAAGRQSGLDLASRSRASPTCCSIPAAPCRSTARP